MKDFPLLMKPEMVRATLALRKTMTRRIVTAHNSIVVPKVPWEMLDLSRAVVDFGLSPAGNLGPYLKVPVPRNDTLFYEEMWVHIFPRWMVGGKFWVRETWRLGVHPVLLDAVQYRADGQWMKPTIIDDNIGGRFSEDCDHNDPRWRPSIYMPRWASRLTLEITRMRAERVQDISEEDAKAEGVWGIDEPYQGVGDLPSDRFIRLWDSINAKKGHGWGANDWVWVPDFRIEED